MSVARQLFERIREVGGPAYECGFCGLTFDREPHNCPACGSEVRRRGKA
jgi:rRNA maturation endonuclease Nob1